MSLGRTKSQSSKVITLQDGLVLCKFYLCVCAIPKLRAYSQFCTRGTRVTTCGSMSQIQAGDMQIKCHTHCTITPDPAMSLLISGISRTGVQQVEHLHISGPASIPNSQYHSVGLPGVRSLNVKLGLSPEHKLL